MSSALCNDCACENVACGRCFLSTHPVDCQGIQLSRQGKKASMNNSKDETSILFEDRLDNYILEVLQIVGFLRCLVRCIG